jgi:dolichyl-phosphate-mannose--protein O-mannosyl transferase
MQLFANLTSSFRKSNSSILTQYANPILIGILAFTFITRIIGLHNPEHFIFDEVYHGITAQLIAQNDARAFEWWHPEIQPGAMIDWLHPPLAKYTQALGILAFGANSFGWRISSVLFGVGVVWLTYMLGKKIVHTQAGLLAATLTSLDGLLFVQSRIAMNDIHVTFFILATALLYVYYWQKRNWKLFFGTLVLAGLALASKWSGLYIIGAIGLSEFVIICWNWYSATPKKRKSFGWLIGRLFILGTACLAIPLVVYVASYSLMFLQGKDFSHFIKLHQQIWWYQTTLEATHTYQSRPWQWFFNLRPVWYHTTFQDGLVGNIYAFGNPLLQWVGVSVVFLLLSKMISKLFAKNWNFFKENRSILFVFFVYIIVWLPWQLSPRIMFYYHYAPAIPFLCILISHWLTKKTSKQVAIGLLVLIFMTFLIWYPHWTGMPVTSQFQIFYTAIKSWK